VRRYVPQKGDRVRVRATRTGAEPVDAIGYVEDPAYTDRWGDGCVLVYVPSIDTHFKVTDPRAIRPEPLVIRRKGRRWPS
jgi:hypothetical protein